MKTTFKIFFFLFCLTIFLQVSSQGQEDSLSDDLIIANKQILYNITEVIDKNGNMSLGFLFGLKSDSLILIRNEKKDYYWLKDLVNIEIEYNRANYKGLVIGSVAGAYLGNIIFFTADEQPTAYWDNEDAGGKIAASLLFAFIGGGIGYLVDIALEDGQRNNSFNFYVEEIQWLEEFERLKEFLIGEEKENKININFNLSQVKTRFSEFDNSNDLSSNYYYGGVTSFNLLRKIQITYSLLNYLDIGGAICWFGEPQFYSYSYAWSPTTNESVNMSQQYEGSGYYASAIYYPFKSVFTGIVSWNIAAGIGLGNVNYSFEYIRTINNYPEITEEIITEKIDKNVFSAMISSQLDLYLFDELSLGFVIDYIFVPGEMPAIPNTDIGTKSLSNYSYGASLGFHF